MSLLSWLVWAFPFSRRPALQFSTISASSPLPMAIVQFLDDNIIRPVGLCFHNCFFKWGYLCMKAHFRNTPERMLLNSLAAVLQSWQKWPRGWLFMRTTSAALWINLLFYRMRASNNALAHELLTHSLFLPCSVMFTIHKMKSQTVYCIYVCME